MGTEQEKAKEAVEKEYRIECEECESVTIVLVEDGGSPKFCPMCGYRHSDIEDITEPDT